MKSFLKGILVAILSNQVRRLRARNKFKIIGVVGSIGKTSTKLAIAQILASEKRVRYQEGNYNDLVSVPLVFFGEEMPQLWNIFSWLVMIIKNEFQIYAKYPYEAVVLELGTDKPGQIAEFRKYLHLDIAVVTAITPEHMEFFDSLQEVAEEEWGVAFFSDLVFANRDLCEVIPENVDHRKIVFYGTEYGSLYKLQNVEKIKSGFKFGIDYEGKIILEAEASAISKVQLYSLCAGVAVASMLGLSSQKIKQTIPKVHSIAGRMQVLRGIKNSTIIDDTYNASPDAVLMALLTLYSIPSYQRVAILGQMNELGKISEAEHRRVGKSCDPKHLDLLVTVGEQANLYIAEEARHNGCQVYEAEDAVAAGKYLQNKIKDSATILAKGSQNGVFTEEALKPLLAHPADSSLLVRQSPAWLSKKSRFFKGN